LNAFSAAFNVSGDGGATGAASDADCELAAGCGSVMVQAPSGCVPPIVRYVLILRKLWISPEEARVNSHGREPVVTLLHDPEALNRATDDMDQRRNLSPLRG